MKKHTTVLELNFRKYRYDHVKRNANMVVRNIKRGMKYNKAISISRKFRAIWDKFDLASFDREHGF